MRLRCCQDNVSSPQLRGVQRKSPCFSPLASRVLSNWLIRDTDDPVTSAMKFGTPTLSTIG